MPAEDGNARSTNAKGAYCLEQEEIDKASGWLVDSTLNLRAAQAVKTPNLRERS